MRSLTRPVLQVPERQIRRLPRRWHPSLWRSQTAMLCLPTPARPTNVLSSSFLMSSPRAMTRLLLAVKSAHAAATSSSTTSPTTTTSTINQHANLTVGPSNGVLDLPGRRDKHVELGDLPPGATPSSSHTPWTGASL